MPRKHYLAVIFYVSESGVFDKKISTRTQTRTPVHYRIPQLQFVTIFPQLAPRYYSQSQSRFSTLTGTINEFSKFYNSSDA